ncbi:MAG: hypothetical protein ABI629_00450 [bacterium]
MTATARDAAGAQAPVASYASPPATQRRWRRVASALAFALACRGVVACQAPPPAPDTWLDAVRQHLERGVVALAEVPALPNSGAVWTLQHLYPGGPPRFEALLSRSVAALRGDPTARLIAPQLPAPDLPADPGHGILRLSRYLQGPYGTPPERASAFVRDFLRSDEQGYILTHQLLAVRWAQQFGVLSGVQAASLQAPLVARVLQEQRTAPPQFRDLYAERVALILASVRLPRAEIAPWIDTITAAQQPDGRWVDAQTSPLVYDGQSATAHHDWTHVSAFAVTALAYVVQQAEAGVE